MGQARDDESAEWLKKGDELYFAERYEEAVPYFQKVLKIQLDNYGTWRKVGVALANLGRYEEAIDSYNQAIEIKPDFDKTWSNKGSALYNLGRYEEAIASYDQVIKIDPDNHEAWSNRGGILCALGQCAEAIASSDRAIEIKFDNHDAWVNRGVALKILGRYAEAIASYDRAIEIKFDKHEAWSNRGSVLEILGRYAEAITSEDRAIEINPDDYDAWCGRGVALCNLGRYEEAIFSYDRAIEINPDDHKSWSNRGSVLHFLGRYPEAIANFDRAIEINPDLHEAWSNRGIVIGILHGYQAEIKAYQAAFQHIHSETQPEGWGILQLQIGRTYYDEGNNQLLNYRSNNPHLYYGQALTSYHNALITLTREQFPQLRLETLIDTAKAHLAQKNPSAARDCQTEALTLWLELIDAQPSPQGKKRLYLEYNHLLRTQVDLSILDGDPIRALEIAEFDKNKHLEWFLYAQEQQGQTASLLLKEIEQLRLNVVGLQYQHMRQLLAPNQAIIYWHLSPDHLTTFILHPRKPNPQILTNSSQQLRNWLKDYDTDKLDTAKLAELSNILQISEINHHLDGIEHLILIPHRDLHRLPLHTYWQNLTTTYLPSIQIGLNLQAKPQPDPTAGFLLVESPSYQATTTEQKKGKALGLLPSVEIEVAVIKALFAPQNPIPRGKISTANLTAKLQQPHYYGHFNGHAYHNPRQPQNSSLILENDDELTCSDLSAIDLNPYHLITLSACQTGVTTHQTIDTEYVGIVSAFLSRGTNYVVSTLWSVEDLPSSLLMMTFYWYLKQGIPAPQALRKAANWLRNLTYVKEAEFYDNIATLIQPTNTTLLESIEDHIIAVNKENPAVKPYSSPYYWAAFTISGWG
jgi:tetratricopeptide (TPR) repeat protein/CHAT domain-containing protein